MRLSGSAICFALLLVLLLLVLLSLSLLLMLFCCRSSLRHRAASARNPRSMDMRVGRVSATRHSLHAHRQRFAGGGCARALGPQRRSGARRARKIADGVHQFRGRRGVGARQQWLGNWSRATSKSCLVCAHWSERPSTICGLRTARGRAEPSQDAHLASAAAGTLAACAALMRTPSGGGAACLRRPHDAAPPSLRGLPAVRRLDARPHARRPSCSLPGARR